MWCCVLMTELVLMATHVVLFQVENMGVVLLLMRCAVLMALTAVLRNTLAILKMALALSDAVSSIKDITFFVVSFRDHMLK